MAKFMTGFSKFLLVFSISRESKQVYWNLKEFKKRETVKEGKDEAFFKYSVI